MSCVLGVWVPPQNLWPSAISSRLVSVVDSTHSGRMVCVVGLECHGLQPTATRLSLGRDKGYMACAELVSPYFDSILNNKIIVDGAAY